MVTIIFVFLLKRGFNQTNGKTSGPTHRKAVTIKELPAKKVAVIQYTGSLCESGITKNTDILTNWLNQQGLKALSPARSAAYDPPWTLPFLRLNEIHIDIE